jgi:hypothetical protein
MLRNVKTRLGNQLIGLGRGYIRLAPTGETDVVLTRRAGGFRP